MLRDGLARFAKVRVHLGHEVASIDELEFRIQKLKAEIAQCEEAIVKKRAQRQAADSVFGSRPS